MCMMIVCPMIGCLIYSYGVSLQRKTGNLSKALCNSAGTRGIQNCIKCQATHVHNILTWLFRAIFEKTALTSEAEILLLHNGLVS